MRMSERSAGMNLLAEKVKKIEMPDDMRKRIIQKYNQEIELKKYEKNIKRKKGVIGMKIRNKNKFLKKQLPMTAALVLGICITGVTALAATGKLEGFFKDIKNWNGAIVGTAYEQATEEITVNIVEAGEELSVLVTIINPENPPYSESELFGIESYRIEDMSGNVIIKESSNEERVMFDNQMSLKIPLVQVSSGEYKLIIEQFISEKKADQPLVISGFWECEFEYDNPNLK